MVVLPSSVEWSWTHGGSCQRDGHGSHGHHHDGQGCVGRHQVGHTLVMVVLVIMAVILVTVLLVMVMLVHTLVQSTHLVHFLPSRSLLLKKMQRLIWIQYGLNTQ